MTEARDRLIRLFGDPKEVFCYVCYPGDSYKIGDSPSKQNYEVKHFKYLDSPGLKHQISEAVNKRIIDEGIKKMFSGSLHNSRFWMSYFHSLSSELGGKLLQYNRGGVKEEDVSRYLIKPLLERAANSSSSIPIVEGGECLEYCSGLGAEMQSQSSIGRGIRPKVDFTMMGFNGEDAVYIIPVEVKITMVQDDMAQIAQYMSTMGNGPHIKDL